MPKMAQGEARAGKRKMFEKYFAAYTSTAY